MESRHEGDPILAEFDEKIRALERLREDRVRRLGDPKRQAIKAEYEKIAAALKKLDELGDDVHNGEFRSVCIEGFDFRINGCDLIDKG